MKKYLPVVLALMMTSVYSLPVRAGMNGDQPEYPAGAKLEPVAGSAQTDSSGAPKLTVEFQTAHAEIPSSYFPEH